MKKVKQNLLKTLLAKIGENKICDSLAGINTTFDILLKEQKFEIREMIEKMEYKKVENEIKCEECSERFRQKECLKGQGFDSFRFQLLKQLK